MELGQVEEELKALIVETLMLEDVTPAEIVSTEPLFLEGLGLDSIDALELAMAVDQRWGVKFDDGQGDNQRIFGSVRSLAQHIIDRVAAQ